MTAKELKPIKAPAYCSRQHQHAAVRIRLHMVLQESCVPLQVNSLVAGYNVLQVTHVCIADKGKSAVTKP